MYVGYDFDNTDPTETEIYQFDFTPDFALGETIVSAVWFCSAASGTDGAASSRMIGPIANAGAVTQQWFTGFLPGVRYLIEANVTTTLGQVLSYWSHVACFTPA
jgi:hypothetical protein